MVGERIIFFFFFNQHGSSGVVTGWSFEVFSVWDSHSLWRTHHQTDKWESQPFPVWGKVSKITQVSRYLFNSQSLTTHTFWHLNTHISFEHEHLREKCYSPEQLHAGSEAEKVFLFLCFCCFCLCLFVLVGGWVYWFFFKKKSLGYWQEK